jgi:PKD repeat protein
VADINGPTEAQVGVSVTFSARDSRAAEGSRLVGFDWEFGDGAGSSGIDVSHTYESGGDYEVTLTVTDDQGLTDSDVQLIGIVEIPPTPAPDEPPQAVISGPSAGTVGEPVTLDASQSQCAAQCVSFAWDLGDSTTANAINVTHIYDSPATYNVILTITDDKGLQGTTNTQLRIEAIEAPAPVPTDEPQPPNGSELEGINWLLDNTLPDTEITALFENGTVSGFGGCNTYSASYQIDGSNMTISSPSASPNACDAEIMTQETAYLSALSAADSFQTRPTKLDVFGAQTLTYTEQ